MPSTRIPSWRCPGRDFYCALVWMMTVGACFSAAQPAQFVTRSGSGLAVDGGQFYFLGANAYYLMESAALGDTGVVSEVFGAAGSLGMSVVRTWAFFDSEDSLNPAVIQYGPGAYNERALRALDYVLLQARAHNIRLLLPLVNSWDEYGGMNQYVRWRLQAGMLSPAAPHGPNNAPQAAVLGPKGQSYRRFMGAGYGHDDFYADSLIRLWYREYVRTILARVNTYTGVRYCDEPMIMAWELANEPRSSDRTGTTIATWIGEMSAFVKSIDQNHLVGTGEEGFDVTGASYQTGLYGGQGWLFDGTNGVSFSRNTAVPSVDFAGIHLYPEYWNLPHSAGNEWIRDHVRIAGAVGKPLVIGEFGVRFSKAATYDSWMTTALLVGVAGTVVWQLLDSMRVDPEGFGFQCRRQDPLCLVLRSNAEQCALKSRTGGLPPPPAAMLLHNYPNPFNGQTTISYALPFGAYVELSVWNVLGERVAIIVDGYRGAGTWKELFEGSTLPSGAYVYHLRTWDAGRVGGRGISEAKKFLLLR